MGGHGSWLLLRLVLDGRACLSDHGELRSSSALARNLVEPSVNKKMLRGANLAEEKANFNGGACDEP